MKRVSKKKIKEIQQFSKYLKFNSEKGRFCMLDSAPEKAKKAYEEYMERHKNDNYDDDDEE